MRKSLTLLLLMLGLGIGAASVKGQLMITEIMYNSPASRPNLYPDSLQFVEIRNTSPASINLSGYTLSGNISRTFPSQMLPPGGFITVCKRASTFLQYFPTVLLLDAWTTGNLDTVSGTILLKNPQGVTVDSVTYSTSSPWPSGGNNDGHSITYCENTLDNSNGAAWTSANTIYPGAITHGIQLYVNPGECCGYTDLLGPELVSAQAMDYTHIGIEFTEAVASHSLAASNFIGIPNISSVSYGSTLDSVVLTLSVPLSDGIFDTLDVVGLQDTACNASVAGSAEIVYNGLVNRLHLVEVFYSGPGTPVDSLQYIEFGNRESFPIQIGGYSVRNGAVTSPYFREQIVQPDGRVVLARFPDVVERVFGTANVMAWDAGGQLGLSDHIEMWNSDQRIDSLTYKSTGDWPIWSQDSIGRSIEICDIQNANNDPFNWYFSYNPGDFVGTYMGVDIYGSPGKSNCRVTSIEAQANFATKVYPNPFVSTVAIETDLESVSNAIFHDVTGRQVLNVVVKSGHASADLSNSPQGIYFVSLVGENGQVLAIQKLIHL